MCFSKDKNINQLALSLIQRGWTYAKGRHYKLFPPNGCGMVVVPTTPSDRRAFLNFRSMVRQRLSGRADRYQHATQRVES